MPRSAAIQAPCQSSASSSPNSNHPASLQALARSSWSHVRTRQQQRSPLLSARPAYGTFTDRSEATLPLSQSSSWPARSAAGLAATTTWQADWR